MNEINQLITDLEAAAVGSRELSDRVLYALGLYRAKYHGRENEYYWCRPGGTGKPWLATSPTMSVDAGLALFGNEYNIQIEIPDGGRTVLIYAQIPDNADDTIGVVHSNLPIALTIAILKAEQSKRSEAMNELQALGQEYDNG